MNKQLQELEKKYGNVTNYKGHFCEIKYSLKRIPHPKIPILLKDLLRFQSLFHISEEKYVEILTVPFLKTTHASSTVNQSYVTFTTFNWKKLICACSVTLSDVSKPVLTSKSQKRTCFPSHKRLKRKLVS